MTQNTIRECSERQYFDIQNIGCLIYLLNLAYQICIIESLSIMKNRGMASSSIINYQYEEMRTILLSRVLGRRASKQEHICSFHSIGLEELRTVGICILVPPLVMVSRYRRRNTNPTTLILLIMRIPRIYFQLHNYSFQISKSNNNKKNICTSLLKV